MSSSDDIIKNRWLGFLIWQSITSTSIYLIHSLLLFAPLSSSFFPSSLSFFSFLSFHLSLLLFSLSLSFLSSPHPDPSASLPDLTAGFIRVSLKSLVGGFTQPSSTPDFRRRVRRTLASVLFLVICGLSGFLSVASVCGKSELLDGLKLVGLGLRGLVFGLVYGIHYVYRRRWILRFPIIQVVHTRRCTFAPPQGSAAAEANPSEPLLEALEQSSPRSLQQYLAYLDLCMVSEINIEPWRRAAFFEETGLTYRRIISTCLRPLEQLTSRLGEGFEGFSGDKSDILSQQLSSPTNIQADSMLHEAFSDFQICAWCARTVAALTAHSHCEDKYGVSQLSGSNKAVVSTLLASLLAVEACMGKKTNPQPAHLMGPASIKWTTANSGKRGWTAVAGKKRGGALHGKAYAMADVLRTSVYVIVSVFQADMQANAKTSALEKNWIIESKPLYGTSEILAQKLLLFLEFFAS